MPKSLFKVILTALQEYEDNHNTGISYEIATLLWMCRACGLSESNYAKIVSYVKSLASNTPKGREQISRALTTYADMPCGRGIYIEGQAVTDIRNVTQNDTDGSTGDLVLHTSAQTAYSLSIFHENPARRSGLEKCLKNPSCRGFGCDDTDIASFKHIAERASKRYTLEMRKRFGPDPSDWKRKKSVAAISACEEVARMTAERFNGLARATRQELYRRLLSLDDRGLPCDYLAIVDTAMRPHFFRVQCKLTASRSIDPTLEPSGVFLVIHDGVSKGPIGRVQVKFNNGIQSAVHSSWNARVYLQQAFMVTPTSLTSRSQAHRQ